MSVADALRFAERVERCCSRTFGRAVAGVILHGSLTLDDYIPGRSDVDILTVVERPLTDTQLDALVEAVAEERQHAPARLDLRVVTRSVASTPTPAPPMEIYIAAHPGGDEAGMHVETHHSGERDLVVEFSVCRTHGHSLVGRPSSELIGDVPERWVVDVGDAQLADWQALEYSARYAELMVLTACRVWRFCEEGRHCSKSAAGEWVLRREPSLKAVREALHRRRADATLSIDETAVRRPLAIERARIAEARAKP
jgi:hypothetical protein